MKKLFGKYTYRKISREEFRTAYDKHNKEVFDDGVNVNLMSFLSTEEKEQTNILRKRISEIYNLYLGVFEGEKMIGWHFGFQKDALEFYMCNTGILPQYQNQGIYTVFLPIIIKEILDQGFQKITSKHKASNNAVLVPKLKANFYITSMDISPRFGTMIHLTFFKNEAWKVAYLERTGELLPDFY